MHPRELEMMKRQALVVIANTNKVDPEVIANHLNISLDQAMGVCRVLIAEDRVQVNKK